MKKNKLMLVVGLVLLASMILTACQPVVTTVEVTKVVTQKETSVVTVKETSVSIVEKTKIVEVERKPFTTPHPILGNLKVRQALAFCTNKLELVKSVYPLVSEAEQQKLVLDSFIQAGHWAYAGADKLMQYTWLKDNPTLIAGPILDEAGWKLNKESGYRQNAAGDRLSLKFTTTNAAFRQTWSAVWEKQMKNCGIEIVRFLVPSTWWFGDTTGLARRDFELGAYAWVGQADPGGVTLWACDQIPSPSNGWEGQNYMGWCNEKASTAIKKANNTLVTKERVDNFTIVQQEYAKDIPALPLFNRTETFAMNPKLEGFKLAPGEYYWNYNVDEWALPGKDTLVIGLTQEPASLFQIVEDAMVARIAYIPIAGLATPSLNYTFDVYKGGMYLKALPTLESGASKNNDVDVKEGDKAVDASGNVVTLKAGMKVIDSTGAEVEVKAGAAVKMKQLVVTMTFNPDLKWSDGKKVVKADRELGYKIDCSKDSGATSFYTCDRTLKYEVTADNVVVFTGVPGYQEPLYYTGIYYSTYPSQRVIADGTYKGKTLADVPAKDWATLPEIATNPIGFGPYVLKEWKKGQQMTFEANPNWVGGKPKTPKLVIRFIDSANAEAQLLAGQVDILGSETLAGVTETLNKAAKENRVKLYVQAGATWEHIDFMLFTK